ncbi:Mg/Co/Ni transporter MgtE, CBS domain-containing [Olavius algarvensis spirochete endosymbiont]|uniref:magnesium transporter n=1 Tax=Olavius algarvensis spirochete endosymbiont TaxID=260710 RepID=UPI000F213B65|nr:magnesium transporter [Olavius algarvensis spirochete endosymbiont]VDA99258.1 Mg/Co/Ni transporter MgtE, CBS domain-containing [Olavius algarvensis spirochete endosymbiont]
MGENLDGLMQFLELDDNKFQEALKNLTVADLAGRWYELDDQQALKFFLALRQETRGELIAELSNVEQKTLVAALSIQATRDLLEVMDPDDLVDLIQQVSPEIRLEVIGQLSEEVRKEAEFLLRFDDDDAAGQMTTRYAVIRADITANQALAFLRRAPEELETIYYVYVVDSLQRLIGVVSLRQILMTANDVKIADVMKRSIVSVREDTDQEETAKVLESHGLIALPVVDRWNRLLGIVTFDDMIEVIREEQSEDIYRMGAIGGGDAEFYLESSIMRLIWRRLPWLVLLLVVGTITTNVLAGYELLIGRFAFLALFIPVITQTGGNSGTQSSTLIIRGLAIGHLHFQLIGRALSKELATGVVIGLVTGGIIFLRGFLLPPELEKMEALAIGISLASVVFFATSMGCLVPFIISRLKGDPAVAAGPMMTTIIDIAGLTVYFEVAKLLLT